MNNKSFSPSNFIKGVDAYGHPIQFRYDNDITFKTHFGGIVTLISRFIIILYFLVLC
jgi:hypothetical protein